MENKPMGSRKVEFLFEELKPETANILESITDGLVTLDGEWRYTFVNSAAEAMFGHSRAELLGKCLWEVFPSTLGTNVEKQLRRALAEQVTCDVEGYSSLSGRWYDSKVYPTPDGGIAIYVRDITEHKQAEEKLRDSEALFARAFNASPLILTISSMKTGKLIEVNETFVKASGYARAEALGRSSVELGLWVDPQARETGLNLLKALGQAHHIEHRFRNRHGEDLFGILSVELIEIGGEPCVLTVIVDITERKRAEEALRAAREQLQMITDTMAAAVTRCNREGRYIWVSRGYANWLGHRPAEIAGRPIQEVIGEEAYTTIRPYIDQVLSGQRVEFETLVNYQETGLKWINAVYMPTYGDDCKPDGWVAVDTDITERKELEQALKEAARRKDEFLATLAHELRNPLAPLQNGLEILRHDHNNPETVEQALGMMERQLRQMVRLIDDLLDLSRISRGRIELRMEEVELADVVHHAVETSRPLIEQSGHELLVVTPTEPILVKADVTRLAQVFSNLLNNAAKYSDRGGRIHLIVKDQESEVRVSVKDNGIGIPPPMLSRVFDMFTQVDRSLEKSQSGLGIGLSIVKQLVEMHGGRVEAHSAGYGLGSEFVVCLPLIKPPVERAQLSGKEEPSARPLAQLRILVTDDNQDSASSLALLLNFMGNVVRTAFNGLEAVEVAEAFRPHVILMDIGMPVLNGYEACRRLRAQSWGQEIVMIALTGWGQEEDQRQSQEAGFNHHLVKPINLGKLEKLLAGLRAENASAADETGS